FAAAGVPHPQTAHARARGPLPRISPPVVVKPRLGSWGSDVFRCECIAELRRLLDELSERPWFRRKGALVQSLVPPAGYDLRLLVAGHEVVGAEERIAAPHEWRTNISLGGTHRAARVTPAACALAVEATDALGADLAGVDLLPMGDDYVVVEVNGAVDF